MIINIQTLINQEELSFDETAQVNLSSLNLATTTTDYMTKVYGTVARYGDLFTVEGYVDLDLKLLCDRCMGEFSTPIHAPLYCQFTSTEEKIDEEEGIKRVSKSSIDLSEDILQAIVMDLPMKALCKANCKGMCKKCGIDLNKGTCSCDRSDIDPRLEQLKDIFSFSSQK
ncbi:MAG: YceD family protein [Cellulosilyticaceae bacterium]